MAVILAQSATGTSNLASTTVTWSNNTTTGNTIVVVISDSSTTAGDVSGVTDSQGNTYTKVFANANALIGELEVWFSAGIIGGTTPTITVAYTTGVACAVIAKEYWGLYIPSQNPLDQNTSTTGNSTSPSSGNIQLVQPVELLVGAITAPISTTFSAGTGFSNLTTQNGTLTIAVAVEDQYVTSIGPWSATFGVGAVALQWVCGIVSFFQVPMGTTTSTSFTTSTSISSTSASSTSSSISSTSTSISTSSTSTSQSSTSSSISSTSTSVSSTSASSTSSSTSISSTSTSISSTSTSSTSISSTSSSTSISQTTTSISSTSSSISSTSTSISSTSSSTSISSTSTSTSTTTLPPQYLTDSYQSLVAYATPTLVQTAQADTPTATQGLTLTATFTNNITPGNMVIVCCTVGNSAAVSVTGFVDGANDNFTIISKGPNFSAGGAALGVAYTLGSKGLSKTVTAQFSAATSTTISMIAREYSGVYAVDSQMIYGTPGGIWSTGTSATPGDSVQPYFPNEMLIGMIGWTTNRTISSVNWNDLVQDNNQSSAQTGMADLLITTPTLQSLNVTPSGSITFGMVCLGFLPTPIVPSSRANLANTLNARQYGDVSTGDGDYFIQTGTQFIVNEFKHQSPNNSNNITVTWKGRTTLAPSTSPVYLQIYNQTTALWETIASQTVIPADTDFILTGSPASAVANYYDSTNTVDCRVYQLVV